MTIIQSKGNVQANWNESDTTAPSYIQNKPTIPAAQVQANWNETNSSSKAYIQNKPTIPSGSSLVPSTTGVTSGYVLTNSSGTPTWLAAAGGGGYEYAGEGTVEVSNLAAHGSNTVYLYNLGTNKDWLVFAYSPNTKLSVRNSYSDEGYYIQFDVINNSNTALSTPVNITCKKFSRPKVGQTSDIVLIGTSAQIDFPTELPAIASGDGGKALTVNSGATGVEWAALSVPAVGTKRDMYYQGGVLYSDSSMTTRLYLCTDYNDQTGSYWKVMMGQLMDTSFNLVGVMFYGTTVGPVYYSAVASGGLYYGTITTIPDEG